MDSFAMGVNEIMGIAADMAALINDVNLKTGFR